MSLETVSYGELVPAEGISAPTDMAAEFMNKGLLALKANALNEAMKFYRQAADEAPEWEWPWICLSIIHRRTGNLDDAVAKARKAVSLDQRSNHALHQLGTILMLVGEL